MTRKHYEAFAKMLLTISPNLRKGLADKMVKIFEEDNPKFDKRLFLKAAGL